VKTLHEDGFRRQKFVQSRMRIAALRDESHTAHDPPNVGVGRKVGTRKRKQKNNTCGLGSNTRNRCQPFHGLREGESIEEREIKMATMAGDPFQSLSNRARFLVLHASYLDGPSNRILWCELNPIERFECGHQGCERSISIDVIGVLRKDGENKILHWITHLNQRSSKSFDQLVGNPHHLRGIIHLDARIDAMDAENNWCAASSVDTIQSL